ncbi:MAG: tetraacyldisaccharide 4'-kinase [Planctomycetota bacterium]
MADWSAIVSGRERGVRAGLLRAAAAAVEPAYRLAVDRRNASFDAGRRAAADLGRPTLSVGNLTAGGTGKTPVTIDVALRLAERGHRPGVLTRGYRGGDEAEEMRVAIGAAGVVGVGASRVGMAARVLAEDASVTCFVLDDGFQHRQARRDVDLVLVDATAPFGPIGLTPPRLIPRGLLREPMGALRRADAVVVTRADQADAESRAWLAARIAEHHGAEPAAQASMGWGALDGSTASAGSAAGASSFEREIAVERLAMLDVVAVSGIGNPAAFEATLGGHARRVIAAHRFPDHHRYTPMLLRRLLVDAKAAGAHAVVTTEKDWAKWRPLLADGPGWLPADLPILRPRVAVAYDRTDAIEALLDRLPLGDDGQPKD